MGSCRHTTTIQLLRSAFCKISVDLQGETWDTLPTKLGGMLSGAAVVFDNTEDIVKPRGSRQVHQCISTTGCLRWKGSMARYRVAMCVHHVLAHPVSVPAGILSSHRAPPCAPSLSDCHFA